MVIATVAATVLLIFSGKSESVLWGFTVLLGLSFATVNGATVSWAASHLPGKISDGLYATGLFIVCYKYNIHHKYWERKYSDCLKWYMVYATIYTDTLF